MNPSLRTSPESSLNPDSSTFVWRSFPIVYKDNFKLHWAPKSLVLRSCIPSARKFVRNLYCLYKVGINEPNVSFLRVSSAMDQLASPEELRKRCDLVDKINWP